LDTHYEKESCQDTVRNKVKDYKEGASHGAKSKKPLSQVRHSLFDNVSRLKGIRTLIFALLIELLDSFSDAKGFCVKRGLGDQPIGEGQSENAGYPSGDAEKEEVPVKSSRLSQWELASLCDEG
jgi:hypothetical protein